jgi:hypothetical protein
MKHLPGVRKFLFDGDYQTFKCSSGKSPDQEWCMALPGIKPHIKSYLVP